MNKLIQKINNWLDKQAISRFVKLMPKELIRSLYRQIADKELDITTREVSVKKGKIRYTLLIAKDRNLETKFNLGRHE